MSVSEKGGWGGRRHSGTGQREGGRGATVPHTKTLLYTQVRLVIFIAIFSGTAASRAEKRVHLCVCVSKRACVCLSSTHLCVCVRAPERVAG
jgi:hypothetical protein